VKTAAYRMMITMIEIFIGAVVGQAVLQWLTAAFVQLTGRFR
jgi:hypothetical protein